MADYAISNVPRRVVYAASGVGPYSFTFEILVNTDVAVYKDNVLLTLTTDYTVTINANGTGSITLTASPTGADQIAIVGARAIQRTSDFVTGGDFFANTVNDEMDSLTIFAQQNAEAVGRALQAPQTDPTNINMTLPRANVRASKTLAFDASGNPVVGEMIGDNRGDWEVGTDYNRRDIVKDTTNDNIYFCLQSHRSVGVLPIDENADVAKWSLLVDSASAAESADAAAASEAAAAASESAAAASESAAAASESAAAASAASAASSYDSFDDRYLGAKTSNPSTDNDGNALIVGAIYFNTSTAQMFVWNGTAWQAQASEPIDFLAERTFTATAGQFLFNFTGGFRDGFTYVWVNGVLLDETEVVLSSPYISINPPPEAGLSEGDIVRVLSFKAVGTITFEDIGGVTEVLDTKLNVANPSMTGNLTIGGTSNRIIGDFSNATTASRALFQTSEADAETSIGALPKGLATSSSFVAYGSSTAGTAPRVSMRASGSDAYIGSSGGPLYLESNGQVQLRLDSFGNFGIGGDTLGTVAGVSTTSKFCVKASGTSPIAGFVKYENTTAGSGAGTFACRSRGTSITPTVVQNGDSLWNMFIAGHDGTDLALAAEIAVEVDGTPGSDDMPGRIVLKTTPDGSQIPVEVVRIDKDGMVGIGMTPTTKLDVNGQMSRKFTDVGTNTAAQDLATNYVSRVTISANTTLTTTVPPAGSEAVVIVVTSGVTTRTVTFGTGFRPVGTLATGTVSGRIFVFRFISDGTSLIETSRTAAIV